MFNKVVFLGSDHGGYDLKGKIKFHLDEIGIKFFDMGSFNDERSNYVDYAKLVAEEVTKNNSYGVLCCSSGIGVSIVANKIPGVRAALCTSDFHAEFSRRHNNANIICFGQKVTESEDAVRMLDIFLNTDFDGGRHEKRVNDIIKIEKMIKENI